jgi:NAD+ synthase (glutamine-hydrolysing)
MLRLALAQLNLTVGDLAGNARLIEDAIRRARAWMADLVLVPELSVTGYPPEDLLLKPQFVEANRRAVARLAATTQGITALVGFVDRGRQGELYNAAAVLNDGRWAATYRKELLPNTGVFDEKRYFRSGSEPILLNMRGARIGLTICMDLWEDAPCRRLSEHGAQVIVNLSASPYHVRKLGLRERLFAKTAKRHRVAIAYCNLVGGQDELVFDGASLVFDRRGRIVARAAQFREDLLIADLTVPPGARSRLRTITVGGSDERRAFLAQGRCVPRLAPTAEVYEALTLGLRDYVRKNGFATVVLGLSGGIDSALTACLAVDALGPAHVVGLIMPSRFSSPETQADAKRFSHSLGIETHEISIEPVFRAYLETLKPVVGGGQEIGVTEQNIQARIRGNFLMALSNAFGWLVLTTGNKSEMATGYTTLYGDMAGGLAVIKDVPKTLVYRLATYRNQLDRANLIPPRILRRAPTAELAPHQRDQDTLPPYEVLDRVLQAYVEEDRSLSQILARNHVDPRVAKRVLQMVDRSEYKRRQGPPGIKITPRAFGKDRRMPITNRYRQY